MVTFHSCKHNRSEDNTQKINLSNKFIDVCIFIVAHLIYSFHSRWWNSYFCCRQYNCMEQNLTQIKVIVVGDSGVGKSSILFRFVNDEFNEFSEATLGAAFVSKVHTYGQDKTIRFQVWDTAGQEKYKSIAPIYYRESQIALCVYDITKKQSFAVLKNWVDELKNKGPEGLLLAVVGNKIDRTEEEAIGYNEVKQYAESIGAMFKLTSAKDGKGINQLFSALAEKYEQVRNTPVAAKGPGGSKLTSTGDANKKKKGGCCGGKQK